MLLVGSSKIAQFWTNKRITAKRRSTERNYREESQRGTSKNKLDQQAFKRSQKLSETFFGRY